MSSDLCVVCDSTVRPRQEGLQCDVCSKWQHRTCNSGVSREQYRSMVRGSLELDWTCTPCAQTVDDQPTETDQPMDTDDQPTETDQPMDTDDQPTETDQPMDTDDQPTETDQLMDTDDQPTEADQPMEPNDSFNISDTFVVTEPAQEHSLNLNSTLDATLDDDGESVVTYQEVEMGTKRGKRKLIDSQGYSYTVKKETDRAITWRCAKRQKGKNCPATVLQHGEDYSTGRKEHTHAPEPGISTAVHIKSKIRNQAKENMFTVSAPRVVEKLIQEHCEVDAPANSRPKPANLIRAFNRIRQSSRPQDPVDLDSEIDEQFLDTTCPDFFKKDITVDNNRHLIFFSNQQLNLLAKAKTWYMDGTFRVVKNPFTQLFSIHAFMKSDDNLKQIPLIFCIMSGRRKADYYAVLRAIDRMLPQDIKLEAFVVDFEIGLWLALSERFPDTPVRGCAFHWSQALYRKIQQLGLQTAYYKKDGMYEYLRQVMALPMLPPEHIRGAFDRLDEKATTPALQELMNYVYNTWIRNRVFKIKYWSVFMTAIRTNNDVEGWHNRLNSRVTTRGPVPFYLLIQELYREAASIPLQLKMVTEGKLCRYQRKQTTIVQSKLFGYWQSYVDGDMTTSQLLKKCAGLV